MTPEELKRLEAAQAGRKARAVGALTEERVDRACAFYAQEGRAYIEKTPEPMRPLTGADRCGRFTACFSKQAQPDYKGVLWGGMSYVMEVKHCTDRFEFKRLTDQQKASLQKHEDMGSKAYVLIAIDGRGSFRVPWFEICEMSSKSKTVTAEKLKKWKVAETPDKILFLDPEGDNRSGL